ncbi:MAG: GTPase HflX [Bdellovibrionales bacterium]|nr:GTPase HflX [Oligoflexia bacterium]
MIENSESLLPRGNLSAFTLGVDDESLNELDRLLDTLDVKTGVRVCAPVRKIVSGTYFGTGKLAELKLRADAEVVPIDAFIVDVELSPRQMQNIEKIVGCPVLDRAGIILEIFSRHAKTREAKTQVELAKLQYVLPRLAHLWSHFERQRGGGVGNKGMGETQIEVDRRLVKRRIQVLRERLKEIEKERVVQRHSRDDLLKVALVGYTNAGKSTLLNALTESNVLAEDKLFATLDSTVRALNPDSHPPVVAIDTVGFISRIPTTLIASFKSTLEEIAEADLIVHVVDASSTQAREQYETTCEVLKELKCDEKETLVVLNKADLLKTPAQLNQARIAVPGSVRLSALDHEAVIKLRTQILDHFKTKMETWDLVIPYTDGKLLAQLQEFGTISRTRYLEKGAFLQVKLDSTIAKKLGVKRYAMSKTDLVP